jgi:hypothetical protein
MMPITEEMPPEGKLVLVLVEDIDGWEAPEYDIGHCWDDDKPKKSKWTLRIIGEVDNARDTIQVTHWAYLPPKV